MNAFKRVLNVLCGFLPALAGIGVAPAQAADGYPAGPIAIVVPFAPGAGTDAIARLVAPELSRALSTPVIVENKGGAAGNIGTEFVVRAKPDGQTLLLSGIWVSVNRLLVKDMRIDPVNELAAVALLARQPLVLVVNPQVKAKSLRELIDFAKANPEALSYGSAGVGNQPHLLAELFKSSTGTQILHVPFKGSGPALTAVIAGDVPMMFLGPSSTVQHIKAGRLRALAISGTARSPLLPDVPTLQEAGLPVREFDNGSWWGISVPKATPKAIVDQLNAALRAITSDPQFRERAAAAGFETQAGTAEDYDRLIRQEAATWQRIIKAAGIVPE